TGSTTASNGFNIAAGCFAIGGNCLSLGNISGTLAVASGGTGASSFGQGWLFSNGGTGALAASTSPTVNYVVATSTRQASIFPYASSTALTVSGTGYFDTASTTNLTISSITNSLLKTGATGIVAAAISGTDYITPAGLAAAFPFTPTLFGSTQANATSTLIGFTQGIYALASSTIGNGTQAGGLYIAGGATTTGTLTLTSLTNALLKTNALGQVVAAVAGTDFNNFGKSWEVSGGFLAPTTTLYVTNIQQASSTLLSANQAWIGGSATSTFTATGLLGVASSSPWGRLAVNPAAGDANQFVVGSSTQTSFVINPSGYVGIGTTSPYGLLSLFAASTSNALSLFNISSTTSNFATTTLFTISNTGSTTASNGFNIAAGCFAIDSTCLSLSTITGTLGVAGGGTGRTSLSGGEVLFGNGTGAIGSVATGTVSAGTGIALDSSARYVLGGNLQISFSAPAGSALSIPYASTTMVSATTASSTSLYISGISGSLLKTNADGQVAAAVAGTDYLTSSTIFGFPFTPTLFGSTQANATSTLIGFTQGIYALASSTIGNGTQAGGLYIAGGATTTGTLTLTSLTNALLKTNALGQVVAAVLGTDYQTFGYLFPNNATTTLLAFNGGLTTTNATATNLFAANILASVAHFGATATSTFTANGSLGVASSTPWGRLAVNPAGGDSNQFVVGSSTQTSFVINPSGYVGIGTTSPYGLLSLFAASTSNALSLFNISSTTSNFATTTLFSIGNTGSTTIAGVLQVNGSATSTITSGLSTPALNITSSIASSTFSNGIQLSGGCFRGADNTCVTNANLTGYVTASGASANQVAFFSGSGTNISSDADLAFDGTTLTARDLLIQHTAPILSINDSDTTGTDFRIDVADGTATFKVDISAALSGEFFAWTTNDNEKMRLTEIGYLGIGTTTPSIGRLTIASTTGSQLALSAGTGIAQWAFRNAGGDLFLSTTTVAGTATTSTSALTISGSGFGTTTLTGLTVNGFATSTSNVGLRITSTTQGISLAGLTSCSEALETDSNGNIVCGTDATTAGANDFVWSNNFGELVAGTSTDPIGAFGGLHASSTVRFGNAGIGGQFTWVGTTGALGLGTTTPFASLQIATTTGKNLVLTDSGAGANLKHWLFSSQGGNLYIGTTTDAYATSTSAAFTILNSGQIGIGTTTPNGIFDEELVIQNVANSSDTIIGFGHTSSSYMFGLGFDRDFGDQFVLMDQTETIRYLTVDAPTRNIGIGTSTPQWLLNPFSSTASQLALSAGAGIAQWAFRNAGGNLYFATTTVAGTATTSTSALTIIGSSGNVGIGTTSPFAPLSISYNWNGGATPGLVINNAVAESGPEATLYLMTNGSTEANDRNWGFATNHNANGNFEILSSIGNKDVADTSRFVIDRQGNVGIGTTSPLAQLTVATSNGATGATTNLFLIASSTASATTTLFSVSNTGTTTLGRFGACATTNALTTDANGNIICGAITAAGDGVGTWFTPTTSFGTAANSTSTLLLLTNGLSASSTVRFGNAGVTHQFLFDGSTGNLGLGTSTPWGLLSVNPNGLTGGAPAFVIGSTTQCVTADTRLRRRRRRKRGEHADLEKGEWEDGEYIYDLPMIKDVRAGDEVRSLDMKTGSLAWSIVNGVIYTGIKPLIRITTQSGRQIRTTDVHPYFVRVSGNATPSKQQKLYRFEVDQSVRFDEYARNTFIAIANEEQSFVIEIPHEVKQALRDSALGTEHRKTLASAMFGSAIALLARMKGIRMHELVIDTEYTGLAHEGIITAILKGVDPALHVSFAKVGKRSPAHKAAYNAFLGKRKNDAIGGTDTLFAQVEYVVGKRPDGHSWEKYIELPMVRTLGGEGGASLRALREIIWKGGAVEGIKTENALRTALYGYLHPAHYSPQALLNTHKVSRQDEIVKKGVWVQAQKVKMGHDIAVVHDEEVAWERVTLIEHLEAESVYDIEIEGTHNFVANNIVAHNTYLTVTNGGNVGIGTASPLGKLHIAGDSTDSQKLLTFTESAQERLSFIGNFAGSGGAGNYVTLQSELSSNIITFQNGGNVGIGTTTPSFGRLTIASTTGSQLSLSAGGGIAQWAFRNAGGNLYFATTTVAGTATTSTSALTIIGSSGYVGVGTTSPQSDLHIASSNNTTLILETTHATENASILAFWARGQEKWQLTNDWNENGSQDFNIYDAVADARRLVINANGNVGIATTTPNASLTVASSTGPQLSLGDGTNNSWTFRNSGATLYLATSTYSATSTTAALTFNSSSGAATFGSPSTTTFSGGLTSTYLNITGTAATSTFARGIDLSGGCFSISGTCLSSGGSGTVGSGTTGQLPYYAANGTTLTATSSIFLATSGNVGLGTENPLEKLGIAGNIHFTSAGGTIRAADASASPSAGSHLTLRAGAGAGSPGAGGNLLLDPGSADTVSQYGKILLGTNTRGNVGLGTTTPYAKLSIHAYSGETNTTLFA
ncbi:MAG: hypothetical protein AAB605_00850, partial [Patescibacteria group bacterium]